MLYYSILYYIISHNIILYYIRLLLLLLDPLCHLRALLSLVSQVRLGNIIASELNCHGYVC